VRAYVLQTFTIPTQRVKTFLIRCSVVIVTIWGIVITEYAQEIGYEFPVKYRVSDQKGLSSKVTGVNYPSGKVAIVGYSNDNRSHSVRGTVTYTYKEGGTEISVTVPISGDIRANGSETVL
jgi:hypothetical protein